MATGDQSNLARRCTPEGRYNELIPCTSPLEGKREVPSRSRVTDLAYVPRERRALSTM